MQNLMFVAFMDLHRVSVDEQPCWLILLGHLYSMISHELMARRDCRAFDVQHDNRPSSYTLSMASDVCRLG